MTVLDAYANHQYRPVTTVETGENDPLSVRVYADIASAENNYKHLVGAPKRGQPCFPYDESDDASTAEHVVKMLGPIYIPDGYSEMRIDACTRRSAGAASVTWTLYLTSQTYADNRTPFSSASFIGVTSSTFFTTSSNGWKWATPTAGAKIFNDTSLAGLYYVTVTAENGDASTRAEMSYFGIRAELR